MTKEKLNKVFDWLEKNANPNGILYFTLASKNIIIGHFKSSNTAFAEFYVDKVLEIIEEEENE